LLGGAPLDASLLAISPASALALKVSPKGARAGPECPILRLRDNPHSNQSTGLSPPYAIL
jgi:hypothetical protein